MLRYNPFLDTDGYKPSQFLQYPPNTSYIYTYSEARGGYAEKVVFFGMQYPLIEYLSKPFTQEDIDEAYQQIVVEGGGVFNKEGAEYILRKHGGYWPVMISAVPEGTVVPVSNALTSVINTDPNCEWCVSYIEDILMRGNWYGTSVATISWRIKQIIKKFFELSASEESMPSIDVRLCDFGARGVSSYESSQIGGTAHLVNFDSTDTLSAVRFAKHYYGSKKNYKLVAASEHSTITTWGRQREVDAYRNMIKQFGVFGIFACVSDSYNIFDAVEFIWGEQLKQEVITSGAVLLIRPDSGKPSEVVLKCLQILDKKFGSTLNEKGYKVIDNQVRIIQGDGIDEETVEDILKTITDAGFSAENVFFGMGGALLQKVNRDTHEFAIKCSSACVDGEWIDVYKDPITSSLKKSKRGAVALYRSKTTGEYRTERLGFEIDNPDFENCFEVVFFNGNVTKTYTLEEIRANSER